MKEDNKIFVTITRTERDDEPGDIVACYYCTNVASTGDPEHHWIRLVKIQALDPFGNFRDFIIELHDNEDVMIEAC